MRKLVESKVTMQMTDALSRLLFSKRYIDITVTDLVNEAEVSRVSFYRNYSNIDDVLDQVIEMKLRKFKERILPALRTNDDRIIRDMLFRFIFVICEHPMEIADKQPDNLPIIFQKFREKLAESETVHNLPMNERYEIVGEIGMITSVILTWMNNGMVETAEEIVGIIMSLLLPRNASDTI